MPDDAVRLDFAAIPGRAAFVKRYPVAAAVLEALAVDPTVSPAVFEQVCEAVFDVADRHADDTPGPPRRGWGS
jgi:hypothetical protein